MDEQAPGGQDASGGFQLRDILAIAQMQWKTVVAVTTVAVLLALLHGLVATRKYRSIAVVYLSPAVGQAMKVDRVVDDQFNRWNRQMFVQTQLEIIHSRKMLETVIQRYTDEYDFDDLTLDAAGVNELRSMMDVSPRQGTELVDFVLITDDPEKSAILANLITETYIEQNLQALRESAQQAQAWLDAQITAYRDRIDESSGQLVSYQRQANLADVQEQITSLTARMDTLNQAFATINTERVLLETTVKAHERLLKQGAYEELAKDMDTTLVASLTEDYASAVTDHAELAARYGEKWPERKHAEAKLERIEAELRAEVERTLSAEKSKLAIVKGKEASLSAEIDAGKEMLLSMQSSRADYDKLKMELDRAKEWYVALNQRNDELNLQAQTQLNNVRVVDEARPIYRAVEPNVLLNLGLALFVGVVGGVGVGLVREYVDDTIGSPLEVQTFLRKPFLGLIPKIAGVTDENELALYSHRHPKSAVAEAMRGIRTVIELDPSGQAPRRLLVTSAVSSEGKTSTVVRMGVAFANLGKRVLMVDADLRRPRVHKIFGVDKDVGLSSVLHGTPLEEAIRATDVPNLDYLPSGKGGERPNELLASTALQDLLARLDERYDLVLIDSPPSVLLSDARILSRYVDGVVLVVREHTTSRVLVREAVTNLEQVGGRVIGVVVNAVDLQRRGGNYKYYYGYGYGYGYGYRYDPYYAEAEQDADGEAEAPKS